MSIEINSRVIADFYSHLYTREKSDSPDKSRLSLIKRANRVVASLPVGSWVLDLGSGRQILEREYKMVYQQTPKCFIATVDIANLTHSQLLCCSNKRIAHVRGDGGSLPFADNTFDLAVSNMALDFMGNEALSSLSRVLKPGAQALVNLHHPSLIPENLDELLKDLERRRHNQQVLRRKPVLTFWQWLRDEDILFKNKDQICDTFSNIGFVVNRVKIMDDGVDTWWEVDMQKRAA